MSISNRTTHALLLSICLVLASPSGWAEDAPPPEVARVVDAFKGEWVFSITVTPPGAPEMKGSYGYDCRPVALGRAVSCHGKGNLPPGPVEEVVVFAWDADNSVVRQLSVGSSGDVGDARCQWNGDKELTCTQQLQKGGKPASEKTRLHFTASGLNFNSTTMFADGTKLVVEGMGSRKKVAVR